MILRGLKNFAKSIKYYLTPLGILTIFLAIALSVSLNGIFNAVKNLFTELGETIGKSSFNWGEVGNSIINSVNGINGDIGKLIDPNWIGTTLGEALKASGLGETIESAGSSIAKCGATIIGMIILFFVLILLGVFMGFAVLSIQVRYNLIKDKWWKVLLYCFLDALILVISIMVLVGLVILWGPFIFIVPLLAILVGEALSIIGAYFIHAFKKVKFKEIFTFKSIALSIVSDIILTIAGILVVVIVALIFKSFVAIIIGLPLFEILLIVSRLTAETYVVDKINEKKLEQKETVEETK